MNVIHLSGNIGQDPKLRETNSGKAVLNLQLAVDRNFTEGTDWIPLVLWGGQATHQARWLQQGSRIQITGRLQTRTWQDREGNNRSAMEVVVSDVEWLGHIKSLEKAKADTEKSP
jgi:single-strand DNA-binding protein